jgi:hypothetical protein
MALAQPSADRFAASTSAATLSPVFGLSLSATAVGNAKAISWVAQG